MFAMFLKRIKRSKLANDFYILSVNLSSLEIKCIVQVIIIEFLSLNIKAN